MKDELKNNFVITLISSVEVVNTINVLSTNKVSAPTSIPTHIFYLIQLIVRCPLANFINILFQKVCVLFPYFSIFKGKGDDLNVTKYRPISLLLNINKIIGTCTV